MLKIEVFVWLTVNRSDHLWFQHTIIETTSGIDFILNGVVVHNLINWGLII